MRVVLKRCGKLFDVDAFAALVRRKRGQMRITQETLAHDVFGDSSRKGDISRIENRKTEPQEATVQKLCTALNISDAEMEPVRNAASPRDQLDRIPSLSREQLQNLAARFEMDKPFDQSDDDLRKFLTQKAEEYRSYKSLIDGLDERVAAIANLKGAAQDAAERLDFDEVEELLARVDAVETTIAAETKEARASNALLRNRPEQAYAIFCSAADAFRELDVREYAHRQDRYAIKLFDHSLLLGGPGKSLAKDMIATAVQALQDTQFVEDLGLVSFSFGDFLHNLGLSEDGKKALTRFENAEKHYAQAAAASVSSPSDWRYIQRQISIFEFHRATHVPTNDRGKHFSAALTHLDQGCSDENEDFRPFQDESGVNAFRQILILHIDEHGS